MKSKQLITELVEDIRQVSKKLGINPSLLRKPEYMANTAHTEWELRKVGGFDGLIKVYFPFPEKELSNIELLRNRKNYIRKLERTYGTWEVFKDQLTESLVSNLSKIKVEPICLDGDAVLDYVKGVATTELHDDTSRSICVALTDIHFGTHIDKAELGGKNEFNWEIAARRFGFILDQIATYKVEQRRLHTEVVFLLGGDLIGGVIHNQEGPDYDLITHQVNGALSYFIQGFEYIKTFFPKIRVVCQPGNHGRMQHKSEKGRALSQKYDSYENIIFYALSQYFFKDPKVEIIVPKSPYADVLVQTHRIYMTHGDSVFTTGNPGKSINTERIEHQAHRVNEEERNQNKKPFKLFVFGHVHQAAHFQTNSGIQIIINGSMLGTDSYANGVGVMSNNPVQIMWETNSKFVVGDSRWLFVSKADKEPRYQKIIRPYNYELQ